MTGVGDLMREHAPAARRWRTSIYLCASIVLLTLVLDLSGALAGPAPAEDEPLASSYSINHGAAFTAKLPVAVGDDGRSPFFRRGVIVWDGGSILGGYKVPAELTATAQTVRLLPKLATSSMSITPGADIAVMLAEASAEVDALHESEADANVCVVMAGAGDIKFSLDVDEIYAQLRQYCLGRRAAGFQVVVVTLLPRSFPANFEADRLALNQRVRSSWPQFADGLADLGADPRIGDTYDDLDQHYFQADGVHPNASGSAVMAAVIAPVLSDLDWKSDGCQMRLRNAGGNWTAWRAYAPRTSWQIDAGDGVKTVEAEYRNAAGTTVAASDSIALDSVGPRTTALRAVKVRRGRVAVLGYRVDDPAPGSPTATVTITIRRSGGQVMKRLYLGKQTVGADRGTRFTCWLPRGVYRFTLTARDAAGNLQTRAGSASLTVTR